MSATCAVHREAAAVATCARCGKFLCDACAQVREEDAYCGECLDLLGSGAATPRAKVTVALAASGFALAVGAPFAAVQFSGSRESMLAAACAVFVGTALAVQSVVLAAQERRRIRQTGTGRAGLRWTIAAFVMSAVVGLEFLLLSVGLVAGFVVGKIASSGHG